MTVFSHHDYDTTISKYAMEMAIGWFRILEYYPLIIGSMLQHCFVYRCHPFEKWGRINKNGTGQVGCPAPLEGSQHLILRPCCALPRARPSGHIEASTGLSEELPKNGDVPKSRLSALRNWQP
jgi:hypothetical protein